jgi:hypothetical protein
MINEANTKQILLLNNSMTAAGTANASFINDGHDFAQIAVWSSITNAQTSIRVEHSDDDVTYAAIGLTSGTDFTIATNGTAAATTIPYYEFNIDTRGLRRYLRLSVTASATSNVVASATLGRRNIGALTTGSGAARDVRNLLSV